MNKTLKSLDEKEVEYLEVMMDMIPDNGSETDTLLKKLKVVQRFGLDISDDDVLALLEPKITVTPHVQEDKPVTIIKNTESKSGQARVYGKDWIVLQNRLLHAISNLTLNERRLVLFLSPLIRQAISENPDQREFTIKVKDYVEQYQLKHRGYYAELERTVYSIQHKLIEFWNFDENKKTESKVRVVWVTRGEYIENKGEIKVEFHRDVIEMLTVFDANNQFTKYQKDYIAKLGAYGIVLFELISSCMYQEFKKKTYKVEYLREKFDCMEHYRSATDLKRYVLDVAIRDIQKYTPYRIRYEQKKDGRQITEFTFYFDKCSEQNKIAKKKKVKKTLGFSGDVFSITKSLSEKQAIMFSNKICDYCAKNDSSKEVREFANTLKRNFSSWYCDELKSHIRMDLMNDKRVIVYKDILKVVGYKES